MAFSVKNEEADRLARELAGATGESLTEAVLVAIRERLERERKHLRVGDRLARLVDELSAYPVLDNRPADAILGFDELGLPS